MRIWNPFKKYNLDSKNEPTETNMSNNSNILVPIETEKFQLRSLKARTEITMLYDQLADQALNRIKGGTIHVTTNQF